MGSSAASTCHKKRWSTTSASASMTRSLPWCSTIAPNIPACSSKDSASFSRSTSRLGERASADRLDDRRHGHPDVAQPTGDALAWDEDAVADPDVGDLTAADRVVD